MKKMNKMNKMNKKITFEVVAKEWLIQQSQNVKATTFREYVKKVNQLIKLLDEQSINNLEYVNLQAILNDMFNSGLAKSTIHKTKIALGAIFNYAMKQNIIEKNPCQFLTVPKQAKKSIRKPITEEQITIIIENINVEFGLYPFMLLFLGLRREELVPLKIEDIDFQRREICVHSVVNYIKNKPVLYDTLKNGDSEKYVSIPNILYPLLLIYKEKKDIFFKTRMVTCC